jgi:hypothetical protein
VVHSDARPSRRASSSRQAFDTRVEGNVAFDFGLFQKQSSFFFQALAARSLIAGSIVYNGPRAGINFVRVASLPHPVARAGETVRRPTSFIAPRRAAPHLDARARCVSA